MTHHATRTQTRRGDRTHAYQFLEAFEEARASTPDAPLAEYLPPPGHPLRAEVLHELLRIDLEHGWARGRPTALSDYQSEYPEAFIEPSRVEELAFEEYRQRLQAGNGPDPEEYARRYGVSTRDWPLNLSSVIEPHAKTDLVQAIRAEQIAAAARRAYRSEPGRAFPKMEELLGSGMAACAEVFRELHSVDPEEAERVARAVTSFPEVGEEFGGFAILAELGRGAFGRVYLARQLDLAGRCVALKVSADLRGESQALAQLLHPNVMPIYSTQRVGPFASICMPYLGSSTLADFLKGLEGTGSLPDSGRGLVSTLRDMGSSKLRSSLDSPSDLPLKEPATRPTVLVARKASSRFALEVLEKYSYPDAVLWLGARLADGLAHAHEHGIQHRDLKPANVLLSDEGQPILLDFNLAEDTKLRTTPAAARVGGTLPYMAPEQLRAMNGETPNVDERSDIFSLGVILYELLTCRHPYTMLPGRARHLLPNLIAERIAPPVPPRSINRNLTPAVEAIVLKALAPDRAHRYQTARALQEDLQRQLAHQPLRHTREPSVRERVWKWSQRHPRLSSTTTIGTVGLAIVGILVTLLTLGYQELARRSALQASTDFHREAAEVQMELSARSDDPAQPERVLDQGTQSLGRFGFATTQDWRKSADYRRLPTPEQDRLRRDAGALLFAMSRASALEARGAPSAARAQHLAEAMQYNHLAQAAFAPDETPRTLLVQRAELAAELGQKETASTLLEEFKTRRAIGTLDQVLSARDHVLKGRYRAALPQLLDVTQAEPRDLQAWFLLACCYDELGLDKEAALAYCTCLAMQPNSYRLHFNRGLAYLRLREYERARRDFTRAIELDGAKPDTYFNRALACQRQGLHEAAIADFTAAMEHGASYSRIHFMRARSYDKLASKDAASQDRERGLAIEPTDAISWSARGLAQLDMKLPEKALADYEQALKLHPRFRGALENKANVLSEHLNRTEAAIQVLDQLVDLYPDLVSARASRGVLYARLGKRAPALKDAEESLLRNADPPNQYQIAGIYALTSKLAPEDAQQSFQLLSLALRRNYGLDLVDKDPDLDPIRQRPEFRQLVDAAKALRR